MTTGIRHRFLTGSDLHEPKGVENAAAGTVYIASGSGSGTWANLLGGIRNANRLILNSRFSDIGTAQSVFLATPIAAKVSKIMVVLQGPIATTDTVVTAKINGIAIQGSTITIPFSGSAAGVVYFVSPTGANTVPANSSIEIITDGATATTVAADITVYLNTE